MDSGLPDRLGLLDMTMPDPRSVQWTPLPEGKAICSVAVLPAGELSCKRSLILRNAEPDTKLRMPDAVFVIEHEPSGERLLFDLGITCPCSLYPPAVQSSLGNWNPKVDATVADNLQRRGVDPASIKRVILSHKHWDHIGNFEALEDSTQLIVGPGTKAAALPGYPARDDATVRETDMPEGRTRELSRETDAWEQVGAARAHDLLGDKSLYLLDMPGHTDGHIAALVRIAPDQWVVLGGDTGHHRALWSPTYPEAWRSPVGVFANKAEGRLGCMHDDLKLAYQSMAKAARFDLEPNVVVLMAHESFLANGAPELPDHLTDVAALKAMIRKREAAGDAQ